MNKKLLLGMLALAASHSAAVAQMRPARPYINRAALANARPVRIPQRTAPDNATGRPATPGTASRVTAATPASWGQMIGQTTYDLQTNRATANRMAMTGTALSAVWTQTCVLSGGTFANRGVGYNFSTDASIVLGQAGAPPTATFQSGTTGNCPSNFGISSVRVGWPEVAHINGNELVVAHAADGIVTMSRTAGTGTWTPSNPLVFTQNMFGGANNGTWPRLVANGNTAHMIYTSNGSTTVAQQPSGVINPMVYTRSIDGGATWDQQNVLLPGLDSTNFAAMGGDSYAIGVNGNTVAIAAGDFGDHTLVWKSTSNGDASTWMPMVIQPDFTDADTIMLQGQALGDTAQVVASDGSCSIVVDNTGTVHYFSGSQLVQVVKDAATNRYVATGSYFPDAVRAMLYWNDRELRFATLSTLTPNNDITWAVAGVDTLCPSTSPFTPCDLSAPPNGGQSRQWYNVTGPISMPTAVVNANGDVYCIYAGGRVGTSNDGTADGQYFRDLYLMRLSFPGAGNQVQVHTPKNISRDIEGIVDGAAGANGEESVFPSAVHTVMGNLIHYQWMSDFEPGNALQPTADADAEVENAIMYDNIDISTLTWTNDFVLTGPLGTREEIASNVVSVSASPNPTTGKTTLNLNLKQDARATIVVRNVLGQEVLRLPATALTTGMNSVSLDLSNQGSGVYFYTVAADKFTLTQRVVKQ